MSGLLKFFGIIGFIAALFFVRSAIIKSGIESESLAFVKDTVGTVTRNWNRAELDRHADATLEDQVRATGNPHVLDFAYFAKLGIRTSELACELRDYNTHKSEQQNYVAANYACVAAFERGSATIYFHIMREREGNPWRVIYFDVVSPFLTPAPAKEQ